MRMPIFTLFAATMAISACTEGQVTSQPSTGNKSFGNGPFWDGDLCVEIRPDGKRMTVPKERCPAKS